MREINELFRYRPVANLIRSERPRHILDVGCGTRGLLGCVNHPYVGCDIHFPEPVHDLMRPVQANILALPFANATFDLVVCNDVLEHLSPSVRRSAVQELIRVSARFIWLAFPGRPTGEAHDRDLYGWYQRTGEPVPQWLREHLMLTLPDGDEVAQWLDEWGVWYIRLGNENVWVHRQAILFDMIPQYQRFHSLLKHIPFRMWESIADWVNFGPCYRDCFLITINEPRSTT